MSKQKIPPHIRKSIVAEIENETPYSVISEKYQVGKATINRIKMENGLVDIHKPISANEIKRRKKIIKSAATAHAYRKGDLIAEGFFNAFEVLAYNSQHLVEIIDKSKEEADALKAKQEEILKKFEEYVDISDDVAQKESRFNLNMMLRDSIRRIDEFFPRLMIRIKAVGEMRKQLETFIKLKSEIMDIRTIKNMLDAFFKGCDELDDESYIKYRDRVVLESPITKRLFVQFEDPSKEKS